MTREDGQHLATLIGKPAADAGDEGRTGVGQVVHVGFPRCWG